MKKVTLAEVARQAGVGKATASRALNGRKGVLPDTWARVLAVAEALDFVPDPLSQRLSARRGESGEDGEASRGRSYVSCGPAGWRVC